MLLNRKELWCGAFYLNDIYNSSQSIFATMIGFVTWPPFCTIVIYKGDQVTKPIIVVKMSCELLYVIQVKGFLIKSLISYGKVYAASSLR